MAVSTKQKKEDSLLSGVKIVKAQVESQQQRQAKIANELVSGLTLAIKSLQSKNAIPENSELRGMVA